MILPQQRHQPQQRKKKKIMRVRSCVFCDQATNFIDYKDVTVLMKFQSEGGRILSNRISGVCQNHQKQLMKSIKRARNLALVK